MKKLVLVLTLAALTLSGPATDQVHGGYRTKAAVEAIR